MDTLRVVPPPKTSPLDERVSYLEHFLFGLTRDSNVLTRTPKEIEDKFGDDPMGSSWVFRMLGDLFLLKKQLKWYNDFIVTLRDEGILPDWFLDLVELKFSLQELEEKRLAFDKRIKTLIKLHAVESFVKEQEKIMKALDLEIDQKKSKLEFLKNKVKLLYKSA